jgi:hypothetical protein
VSVDTYLKGKNLRRYSVANQDDVKIYLSPALFRWARSVSVDVGQFLFWRSFQVQAEARPHRHGPTCAH